MYCSLGGKAFWKSLDLGVCCKRTATATTHRNVSWDITSTNQSRLLHVCGYKFSKIIILNLTQIGLLSTYFLIVEIAILGSALRVIRRNTWFSFPVIYFHVLVLSVRPKYSLRYA